MTRLRIFIESLRFRLESGLGHDNTCLKRLETRDLQRKILILNKK